MKKMERKNFHKSKNKIVNALDHKPKDEEKEIGFQVLDDEDIPF